MKINATLVNMDAMLQVKPPELLRNKVALYIWVNYRYQINIVLRFID